MGRTTRARRDAAVPATPGGDDVTDVEPSAASARAGELTTWERWWEHLDRWGPYGLLAVSLTASLANPVHTAAARGITVGVAVLAAAWIAVMHTAVLAPRRDHPAHAAFYFAGLIVLASWLMARDVVFFVFAITGFFHAVRLRPHALIFVGTGATAFAINVMTWGGLPRTTNDTIAFTMLTTLQTFTIGAGILGGERMSERSEQRRSTVERLEATLAENEGLHAQLVRQAREAGTVDERQRLAREIHDTLAQGLTGIITQLEAAEQSRADPDRLHRHLATAAGLARDSLQEARRSVRALGPGALERGRLVDALGELTTEWSQRTGVTVDLHTDSTDRALPAAVEVELLRIAQEALTNVAKHAAATRVGVTLSCLSDEVVLDVRDDGHGFERAAATDATFGLASMRQRAAGLGGTLTIETHPGAGTAICAAVPTGGSTRS